MPDTPVNDEGTPARLRSFRSDYAKAGGGRIRPFDWLLLAAVVAGFGGMAALYLGGTGRPTAGTGDGAFKRELAAYLAEKNQPELALATYEEFLSEGGLPPAERAKVCYSVAQLALDVDDHAKALRYLYESELLDPDSPLKSDIDKQIVRCLEKLGRAETLRRELRSRSSLQQSADTGGATVLAEFAGEVVTDRDLEREIEKLPASARDSFETTEQKTEFLKNLVAERLLLDKAVRLGYDEDESIQETLARQRDSLIVRKLIDEEVRANLNVTDQDVERFYKAEIDLFTTPASARGALGIGATEEEATGAAHAPDAQQVSIARGRVAGANLTEQVAQALSEAVLAESGDADTVVTVGDTAYAFHGTVTPAEVRPFSAVKERAAQMYRARKEQELLQQLIASTLEARNVKLYPERLKAGEAQP